MNKQICDKIKFMISGISYRIGVNRDFIKDVNFVFNINETWKCNWYNEQQINNEINIDKLITENIVDNIDNTILCKNIGSNKCNNTNKIFKKIS
jgi:hypothetical protein